MLNKKIIITSLIGLMAASLGVALSSKKSFNALADETVHSGKHYTMLRPTETTSGVKEYWVCCDCHEHFLTKPTNGTWEEAGEAKTITDSSDDRYLAANQSYADSQGLVYSADGNTITGYTPVVGVTDIVIPDYITDIGTVFAGTSITSISIPGSIETIDGSAFRGCTKLKSVSIAEGVEDIESSRGTFAINGAFQYCTSLEYVVIPSTVTTLDAFAFGSSNRDLKIFCSVSSRPRGWSTNWNQIAVLSGTYDTYWLGQWHYDANGVPVAD